MDVCDLQQALQKHLAVEASAQPPLMQVERKNETATGIRHSRTREVTTRHRSPTPVAFSVPRRYPSPTVTRAATSKRAISTERKRSLSPSSPSSPPSLTPAKDTVVECHLASRKGSSNKLPESLWPSTMRNLNVSFQRDNLSVPIVKKEKPVSHAIADRTLRPSCNVPQKQNQTPPSSRKSTPERKRSPVKAKNSVDLLENSKPVECAPSRLIEQHRWPSRTGGKVSSNVLNRSNDFSDKSCRISSFPESGNGVPSLRRLSLDGMSKPSQKSVTELLALKSSDEGLGPGIITGSIDDNSLPMNRTIRTRLSERAKISNAGARTQSLPTPGSRPASPNRGSTPSSSVSRGVSPSRVKTPSPVSSRGPSPSRPRLSSPSRQSNPTSVLSFIADIRQGKKAASHIEDVHQLRLLHNRYLQWRYANALSDVSQHSQKEKAERTMYGACRTTSCLLLSVIEKRMSLIQMRLYSKLCSVINPQLAYLDEWESLERDHTDSLHLAFNDLQATTLRLPLIGGAWGDTQNVKAAVCSALDVMQAMGSSVGAILSQMEKVNCLVSKVGEVVTQETVMLDECESFLGSAVAMQIEEYSHRINLMQLKEDWRSEQLELRIKEH